MVLEVPMLQEISDVKSAIIDKNIEKWKENLLDLSKRNNMINFKYNKKNVLKVNEDLNWLHEVLIQEENSLIINNLGIEYDLDSYEENKEFEKLLAKLRQKRNSHMKEKGINVLYITLGMLKWKEADHSNIFMYSPILMIPVELSRDNKNSPFKLSIFDNQCIVNPALQYKLKADFGIEIVEIEEEGVVSDFLDNLAIEISQLDSWEVINESYLGLFSFSKIALYHDLIRYKEKIKEHPVIGNVASNETIYSDESFNEIYKIDSNENALESYQVLDADSSQQEAAITAKKGYSFVMQGPPGTGKSQTITNIIAECLAVGKTVLFVSEKMAALEVVKKRLESVGLGDFCLELHSNKANKKTVITELYNQYSGSNLVKSEDTQFLYNYENIKSELNNYIEELHRPYAPLNKSAFWYHGKLSQLSEVEIIQFKVDNINILDQSTLAQVEKLINELQLKQNLFPIYKETFWRYTTIRELSMNKTNDVKYHLSELLAAVRNFNKFYDEIQKELGIQIPNINSARTLKNVFLQLTEVNNLLPNWFKSLEFDNLIDIVEINYKLNTEYQNQNQWIKSVYKSNNIHVNKTSYMNLLDELSLVLNDSIVNKLYQKNVREEIIQELRSFNENIVNSNELIGKLKGIFGQHVKNTILEINTLNEIIKILLQGQKVPIEWIENPKFIEQKVSPRITEDADVHNKLNNDLQKVTKLFDKKVLESKLDKVLSIFNKRMLSDQQYKNSLEFVYKTNNTLTRNINDSLNILNRVIEAGQQLKEILGFERELTTQSIGYLIEICNSISKIHYCKKEWLNENAFLIINRKVEKFKGKILSLYSLKAEIEEKFENDVFEVYSEDMFNRFKTQYISALRIFKGFNKDKKQLMFYSKKGNELKTFEELSRWVNKIHAYKNLEKEIEQNEIEYIDLLGNLYQGKDSDLDIIDNNFKAIQKYLTLCQEIGYKNTKFESFVFDKDNLDKIFELKNILSNSIDVFNQKFQSFEKELDLTALDTSLVNLTELQISIKEKLLWIDSVLEEIQNIVKCGRGTLNLSFEELVDYIHTIEEICTKSNFIANNEQEYKRIYGFLYQGINTNWSVLVQLSEWLQKLHESSRVLKNGQKDSLIQFLKNRTVETDEELRLLHTELSILIESLKGNIRYFSEIYKADVNVNNHLFEKDNKQDMVLSSFQDIIEKIHRYIKGINEEINILENHRNISFTSVEEITNDINRIDDFNSIRKQIEDEEQRNDMLFKFLYQKEDTNWFDLNMNIKRAKNIANDILSCNVSLTEELIEFICSKQYEAFKNVVNQFNECLEEFDKYNLYYNDTFELEDIDGQKNNLENLPILETSSHLEKLIEEIGNLELVVKMRVIQDDFVKAELEDFFLKVINKDHLNHSITEVFYKSIYTIILDEIYSNNEVLKKFEKSRFDLLIHSFKELDKKQLGYNSIRIRNRLIENRNGIMESRIGRQQSGILTHENGKKKRHLPIRKLFSNMPDLLQALKPCMLMSPLSVCEFLDADLLQFDVVIFDEASQICPEDAITPMLRGKDVIIGGDIHQLPPTRFFKADLSSDEFEEDEEEESIVYESILDMCANIMPQKNLKWHYRSRHESLIAFSNKNFYNNSLYTFPSPEFTNEKQGVRFEYVKNGVYDRSGKRTNAKEADRVVDLVFSHYRENPSRSLGVIAFSQAQMEEIEDKINDRLNSFPELEQYFNENIEDAFFVKNLENVQGDERDTIIISIGYGKDSNGNLNHNFGPLNKAGGERRLNVAVTRSKQELVLVSSINDLDIDLKRTNSIGVRLLKEYIQFARTGILPESIFVNDQLDFDSPLEQDIYNSLVRLGYEVHTQVGSSGYRIDLAIVDPKNQGRYLLGVECDGATYHSTKSARDRDRLRQEVLENLGWKIYRIWSQDWFKHKDKEIEKISSFINALK